MLSITDISPYDESFPIKLLSDAFNMQLDKAEKTSVKVLTSRHKCDIISTSNEGGNHYGSRMGHRKRKRYHWY